MAEVAVLNSMGDASNIAHCLRVLADRIDDGVIAPTSILITSIDKVEGTISTRLYGKDMSVSEAMGALNYGSNLLFRDSA